MFTITKKAINLKQLRAEFGDESCGAVVVFEGLVRNHHDGKDVSALSYEHHPVMAEPEGVKIITEITERFPITHALAIHRVGDVPIGEAAVVTMVASSHRAEAFEACLHLIDEIKKRVPIWKFETYTDGTSVYTEQCEGCVGDEPKPKRAPIRLSPIDEEFAHTIINLNEKKNYGSLEERLKQEPIQLKVENQGEVDTYSVDLQKVIDDKKSQLRKEFRLGKIDDESLTFFTQYADSIEQALISEKKSKRYTKVLTGVTLLFSCVLLSFIGFLAWNNNKLNKTISDKRASTSLEETLDVKIETEDFKNTEEFVKGFLQSPDLETAMKQALPDEKLKEAMEKYWKPHGDSAVIEFRTMNYIPETQYVAFYFQQILNRGSARNIVVFMDNEKNFWFDWRSYVGIEDFNVKELPNYTVGEVYVVRAVLSEENYYNYGYEDDVWGSYALRTPLHKPFDSWINVYANQDDTEFINKTIKGGMGNFVLEVKWTGKVAEIVKVLSKYPHIYSLQNSDLMNE